jgi:hypothetical protein
MQTVPDYSLRGCEQAWRSDRGRARADANDDSGLCAGDRGVVDQIDERGYVFVSWDRGFASEIDPESMPIHPLAA